MRHLALAALVVFSLAGCSAKPLPVVATNVAAADAAALAKFDPAFFDDLSEVTVDMAVKDENWDQDLKAKTRAAKYVHVYMAGDQEHGGEVTVVYGAGVSIAPSSAGNLAKIAHIQAALAKLAPTHPKSADVQRFADALGKLVAKHTKAPKPAPGAGNGPPVGGPTDPGDAPAPGGGAGNAPPVNNPTPPVGPAPGVR